MINVYIIALMSFLKLLLRFWLDNPICSKPVAKLQWRSHVVQNLRAYFQGRCDGGRGDVKSLIYSADLRFFAADSADKVQTV